MGRWDENTAKKNLNDTIEKKTLKINNFILNPPNQILKYIFLILTLPNRLIHHNSRCSKFVQKHIIIISPTEYIAVILFIMFAMWFLVDLIPSRELQIVIHILLYVLILFFGMARSGGGGRKDKPDPTNGSTDEFVKPSNQLIR